MKIAIGSDHRGFKLKEALKSSLESSGHEVCDFGAQSGDSVDYPKYAKKVSDAVSNGRVRKGILICGSGLGMCMAANKVKGIRAALAREPRDAEITVRHNNANIVCIGADYTGKKYAEEIVEKFLNSEFEGGRHNRRIEFMMKLEDEDIE